LIRAKEGYQHPTNEEEEEEKDDGNVEEEEEELNKEQEIEEEEEEEEKFVFEDGDIVFPFEHIDVEDFFQDLLALKKIVTSGPVGSYSYKRLALLESKFRLHVMLNEDKELEAQRSVPHRDFYNVRKVDTHIHHSGFYPLFFYCFLWGLILSFSSFIFSAAMTQKHLLRFIKKKLRICHDEVSHFFFGVDDFSRKLEVVVVV